MNSGNLVLHLYLKIKRLPAQHELNLYTAIYSLQIYEGMLL